MAFEFRGKWYTQKKKVKLLHPKKDTNAAIKDSIMYIEDNHLQNGQPFKNKKRHDNKKKEELISRLMELWDIIGTEVIHEVEDNNKANSGLPTNRVVYYPSHRYRVNFYQSKLIGGHEAVHTQQALTRFKYPHENSENIILICGDDGEVSDDFYKQQPIDFSTHPKDYPTHVDIPFPGKSTIVPFDPVPILPGKDNKDPLDIYTAEMKESHAKELKPVLLIHKDASLCASHWGKNPLAPGSLYHGACCHKGVTDWHAIFVPPQPQAECHQCGGIIHVECALDVVMADVDVGTCTFCFGCCPDQKMKKKYWLEALLKNKLKLVPPPPVVDLLYKTRPHYQRYPKVSKNGVNKDRYLPKGVVQMCCCLHNGEVFIGRCQELGYIQQQDKHGQCLVCHKYLHTKCSVYDIVNKSGDHGTKHLCYKCLSHSQTKIVERYWEDHKTEFTFLNEGHKYQGLITWIPYPVGAGDGPPTASAGGDGPPTASAGGDGVAEEILAALGGPYNPTFHQPITMAMAQPPTGGYDPKYNDQLLKIAGDEDNAVAVAASAVDVETGDAHGLVQPDLEESCAAKQQQQEETVGTFRTQDLVCFRSPGGSDYPSIPSWNAFLESLDPHAPPVVKEGQAKLTPEEYEENVAAQAEYDAVAAYKYILLLYDKGVFQCPGSMQSLTERRTGLFKGRAERRDGRFQDVTTRKDRKSTPLCFHYDDEAEAEAASASASHAGASLLPLDTDSYEYQFKEEYPFQWHHNWVGVSHYMFRLDPAYIKDVMTALKQLSLNPKSVKDKWQQMNKPTQHIALMKHTGAIVYFAIATQTGPLFEVKSKDHWTIGLKQESTTGYKEHERAVAEQLFYALGMKKVGVDITLKETPGPGKAFTGKTTFNHNQKITLSKTFVLYYLGMSGKPSWDGRLTKNTRKGVKWENQNRKQQTKKSAATQSEAPALAEPPGKKLKTEGQHPMMENQEGSNAMELAYQQAKKDGDGHGEGGPSPPSATI